MTSVRCASASPTGCRTCPDGEPCGVKTPEVVSPAELRPRRQTPPGSTEMLDALVGSARRRRGRPRAAEPHGRGGDKAECTDTDARHGQHARALRVCLRSRDAGRGLLRIGNAQRELQRGGWLNLVELRVRGVELVVDLSVA